MSCQLKQDRVLRNETKSPTKNPCAQACDTNEQVFLKEKNRFVTRTIRRPCLKHTRTHTPTRKLSARSPYLSSCVSGEEISEDTLGNPPKELALQDRGHA